MQVVIPMSGFGERFKAKGYRVPKPLIQVEGKTMVEHVVNMLPTDEPLHFICNKDHLEDSSLGMSETLSRLSNNARIHPIAPHKLGPVHAVLQVADTLDQDQEVVLNYVDFTCVWDFEQFLSRARQLKADGMVPAYKGFHPHSGGTTNYAYIQERNGKLLQIREKQPFTANKTEEFASTGTYYFKSVALMRQYFSKLVTGGISVNGEFYASSAFDLMAKDGLHVGVYEVSHFMQWGTPEDLEEYMYWSDAFRYLSSHSLKAPEIIGSGNLAVLASGRGSRFSEVGYGTPKPFLQVSGDFMINQVLRAGTPASRCAASVTGNMGPFTPLLPSKLKVVSFEEITGGQADSANKLLEELNDWEDSTITVLPSDTLFSDSSTTLLDICEEMDGEKFLVIWATEPSPFALRTPHSFGWVTIENERVEAFIKVPPTTEHAKVISGAFTFSSRSHFSELYRSLRETETKVNGEYYLDSMILIAQELGFKVRIFEPEFCLSLGTPYEFETFRYWQTAFDQWGSHPYRLELDSFVNSKSISQLRVQLRATNHQPTEWSGK